MKNFLKIVAGAFIGSLLSILLAMFILMGIIGSMMSLSEKSAVVVPDKAILKIDFKVGLSEQNVDDPFAALNPFGSSSKKSIGILSAINAIDNAAADPSIRMIYIETDYLLGTSFTKLEELRSAIVRFRQSGKPVVAYSQNYTQGAYYLASSSDKIYMDPMGMFTLQGLSSSSIYLKDLLDKLGIQAQLIRHGKFKAAAESLISNKMSEENREQLLSYLGDSWNYLANTIAEARSIEIDSINHFTNNLTIDTAEKAVEQKFIDKLAYRDEVLDYLKSLIGEENADNLNFITLQDYALSSSVKDLRAKDKIAIIYANGQIVDGDSHKQISSERFSNILSAVRKDSSIKAVVFRVNSPGGSAQASEVINRELQLIREHKPVIVSFGDYAASGGYWISAKSDHIFTNNSTLTGSIGVFGLLYNVESALKKHLNVTAEVVKTHAHGDMPSMTRALNSKEEQFIQKSIEQVYKQFLEIVASGRGLTPEYVDSIAQGRVWSGYSALQNRLADSYGGLYEAINYAAKSANLERYAITEYPITKTSMEKIMEMLSSTASVGEIISDPALIFEQTQNYIKSKAGAHTYAMIPYLITINN